VDWSYAEIQALGSIFINVSRNKECAATRPLSLSLI
jgi:hypothetical protein